jgi:hypothetical protein
MKPFNDQSQFRTLPLPESGSNRFNPSKSGYGVEIRRGRDINKRSSNFFISSGRWAEMPNDGIIDQEVSPAVLGELIDSLNFSLCFFRRTQGLKDPMIISVNRSGHTQARQHLIMVC